MLNNSCHEPRCRSSWTQVKFLRIKFRKIQLRISNQDESVKETKYQYQSETFSKSYLTTNRTKNKWYQRINIIFNLIKNNSHWKVIFVEQKIKERIRINKTEQ